MILSYRDTYRLRLYRPVSQNLTDEEGFPVAQEMEAAPVLIPCAYRKELPNHHVDDGNVRFPQMNSVVHFDTYIKSPFDASSDWDIPFDWEGEILDRKGNSLYRSKCARFFRSAFVCRLWLEENPAQ